MKDFKTLDLSLISPKGNVINIAVTGPSEEEAFLVELLSNSDEFAEWLKDGADCGGPCVGRFVH